MEINLHKLRTVIDLAISKLQEETGKDHIDIPVEKNFYWDVTEQDLFNVSNHAPQMQVGSLVDDVDLLLIDDITKDNTTVYSLIHAAPLLRFVAESITKERDK